MFTIYFKQFEYRKTKNATGDLGEEWTRINWGTIEYNHLPNLCKKSTKRKKNVKKLSRRRFRLTWWTLVAPVITDDTFGFAAHHAIASWANGTPNSAAIGCSPFTFLRTSSTNVLLARFYKVAQHKLVLPINGHLWITKYKQVIWSFQYPIVLLKKNSLD